MKQNLKKITSVILFCLVLIFSGCQEGELPRDNTMINQEPEIIEAKNWFEDYKAQGDFIPIFQDVNYHWDKATTTVLEDGSKALTLPLTDINQDPKYKGEKILYLYPSENGYKALVYELSPDKEQTESNEGFKNLNTYSGYISTWDLKDGFIKGAKFANSNATQAVAFKVFSQEDLKSQGKTSKQIDLLPVIIIAGGSGGGYSYGVNPVIGMGDNIGNYNTGNYFNPSIKGGGGSGSGSAPSIDNNVKIIEDNIDDSKLDPCTKAIMEKLKNATNADIASILKKLGANSLYTVTMKMGPANTYAETQRISKNNYEIRVNSSTYTDGTTLFKATALIHEVVHAYFSTIVDDYNNNYPTNAPMDDFPTLFEAYVKKNYATSNDKQDAQHKEMADKYVDAMASALQEYDGNYSVPYQVYKDLAWGGLSAAPIFAKTFPPGSAESNRILNRFRAESCGRTVGAGTATAQTPVGKPCK